MRFDGYSDDPEHQEQFEKLHAEIERLRAALLVAGREIEWWVDEHRCCEGHEVDAMRAINAALNADEQLTVKEGK